jgi:NADPH:quinone reductase-like Zn-dependent oxidoreductase
VYASLFPAGGGFAELAVASADRVAPMPGRVSFAEAVETALPLDQAREALARVAARHTRGKIVLQIG